MLFAQPDEQYLTWLYSQVAPIRARPSARTYQSLFRHLHRTIFVAVVAKDDNRVKDARDLRYEFLANGEDVEGDPGWMRSPSTMLELLIILSRLLSFEMDDAMEVWFWHLIETLGLERFNDRNYDDSAQEVIDSTLERVIWRNYSPSGHGGLFPLRDAHEDQRKVELWYQLNAYLLEQF